MHTRVIWAGLAVACIISWISIQPSSAQENFPSKPATGPVPVETFLELTNRAAEKRLAALQQIRDNWTTGSAAMLIESARFSRDRRTRDAIYRLLADKSKQPFTTNHNHWYQWLWNQDVAPHPNYARFKRELYSRLDPRFAEYFDDHYLSTIRLDEVRWGGVKRDGIPPLDHPKTIPASEASYLADTDVVFGVEINGHARAYPKRVLAWHEMVKDVVGGDPINGVYCTLCGSMIVYDPSFQEKHYELGTSGFLYRSNKLMYDHETKSMWSTLKGTPVVGPLVGKGIRLKSRYVVTTTWAKWKQLHPHTDVLSLQTGHKRNYDEGAAYKSYFATDKLMFTVPKLDRRLKNKDEILVVRVAPDHVSIASKFLQDNSVLHESVGKLAIVVLTDESGASRVYKSEGKRFSRLTNGTATESSTVSDSDGVTWSVTEAALVRNGRDRDQPRRLERVPSHRAFWFGWNAAYPKTRLIGAPLISDAN